MPRPAKWRSPRGLLLVEAALSAVVIAVGLVFITRSFSSQLRALAAIEEYATLTHVAHGTLLELERDVQVGVPPSRAREGTFDAPYTAYRWTLSASPLSEDDPPFPRSLVRLSVERDSPPASLEVQAVWPADLVPSKWD